MRQLPSFLIAICAFASIAEARHPFPDAQVLQTRETEKTRGSRKHGGRGENKGVGSLLRDESAGRVLLMTPVPAD